MTAKHAMKKTTSIRWNVADFERLWNEAWKCRKTFSTFIRDMVLNRRDKE